MYMLGAGAEPTANLQAMAQQRGFANAAAQAQAMATIKQAKIEAASRMQALGLTQQNEEANRALERYKVDSSAENLRAARLAALGIHQSDQAQALGIHKSDQEQHAGEFAQNLKMEQERNLSQTGNQAALLDQHARDEAARNAIAKRTADREDLLTNANPNVRDYYDDNPDARPAPPVPDAVMHPFEQTPVGSDPMNAFGGNSPSTRPNPVPAGVDPNKPPSWFKPQAAPSAPTSGPDSPPAGGLQSNALSTFAQGASDMYPNPSVQAASVPPQVRMSATRPEEWGPPAPSAQTDLSTVMQSPAPTAPAPSAPLLDDKWLVRHGRATNAQQTLLDEATRLDIQKKRNDVNAQEGILPPAMLERQNKSVNAKATAIAQQKYNEYRLQGKTPADAKTRAVADANLHPELAGMPGFNGLDESAVNFQEPNSDTSPLGLGAKMRQLTGNTAGAPQSLADYMASFEKPEVDAYNDAPGHKLTNLLNIGSLGLLQPAVSFLNKDVGGDLALHPGRLDQNGGAIDKMLAQHNVRNDPSRLEHVTRALAVTGWRPEEIRALLDQTLLSAQPGVGLGKDQRAY